MKQKHNHPKPWRDNIKNRKLGNSKNIQLSKRSNIMKLKKGEYYKIIERQLLFRLNISTTSWPYNY
jgi:hypothetical protein